GPVQRHRSPRDEWARNGPASGCAGEARRLCGLRRGNRTVIATKGDTNIELGIGQRFATVDGNRVDLDAPATIVAGNTMVPLRFISEALGSRVSWNPYSSTVAINTGAATDVAVARPYRSARAHRTPVSV